MLIRENENNMGKINRKPLLSPTSHSPVHLETEWQPVNLSQRAGPASDQGGYSLPLLTPIIRGCLP